MNKKFTLSAFSFLWSVICFGQTVSTGSIAGSPFCPGSGVNVAFTITGSFNAGNVFTAQLSDANGSFGVPVSIGTLASVSAGSIAAQLPIMQTEGSQYRIRVVASAPATIGLANGSDLVVTAATSPFTNHTKTWVGGTGNWDNPSNWEPCGLPNGASTLSIDAGAVITIPAGVSADTRRVVMANGAKLIISAGAVLNNNGSIFNGIQLTEAGTTITNNGSINCGNFAPNVSGAIALFSGSALINNAGAAITINDVISPVSGEGYGLSLVNSSFTNVGNLQIGNISSISRSGLGLFGGQITNTATGLIEINRITISDGLVASGTGTIANAGMIKIGNLAPVAGVGLNISGSTQFTNQDKALIEINNITTGDGISINLASSTFTNAGTIRVGNSSAVSRSGISLFNGSAFTNNSSGVVEIDNITSTVVNTGRGLALSTSSTFTNAGILNIGKTTAIYRSCIFASTGQFTNQATGTVTLNRTTILDGISGNGTGSFTNAGTLKIGNLAPINQIGIQMNSGFKFINQASALVEVNNVPVWPAVFVNGTSSLFTNSGIVKIGNETTLSDGMYLLGGGQFLNSQNAQLFIDHADGITSGCLSIDGTDSKFTNAGQLKIGSVAPFSRRGIDLSGACQFINQSTGTIDILSETVKDALFRAARLTGTSTTFNNAGSLKISLKAPANDFQGIEVLAGSSFTSQTGSAVELKVL